jgi:trehalose-6-phosphatase
MRSKMLSFFAHWPELARRFQMAGEWLLMFDYDGTLAPTALHPSQAKLSDIIRRKLRQLSLRDQCAVAVVSGRALSDLRRRVGLRHVIYIGNHGLEIESNGWGFEHPQAHEARRQLKSIPRPHWNKGSAANWLRRVVSRRTLVLYIGDGPTDEDAFRALAGDDVTLRVGKKKDSAATYYIQRQADVPLVLDKLIDLGSRPDRHRSHKEDRNTKLS